jgi:hypothetical protein
VTKAPCLAEDWFVQEALEQGLDKNPHLPLLSENPSDALRMCFRMARWMRASAILSGNHDEAKKIDSMATLRCLETVEEFIRMAASMFNEVKA